MITLTRRAGIPKACPFRDTGLAARIMHEAAEEFAPMSPVTCTVRTRFLWLSVQSGVATHVAGHACFGANSVCHHRRIVPLRCPCPKS